MTYLQVSTTVRIVWCIKGNLYLGLVEDQGFLDQLKELLSDSNPMVVANAVAALSEINESSPTGQPLVGNYDFFFKEQTNYYLYVFVCSLKKHLLFANLSVFKYYKSKLLSYCKSLS